MTNGWLGVVCGLAVKFSERWERRLLCLMSLLDLDVQRSQVLKAPRIQHR